MSGSVVWKAVRMVLQVVWTCHRVCVGEQKGLSVYGVTTGLMEAIGRLVFDRHRHVIGLGVVCEMCGSVRARILLRR